MSSKLQVRLPIRLAKSMHIQAGDQFYWRVTDDMPDVLQLVPEEVVERRYSAGERIEAAEREVGQELTTDHPGACGGES